MEKSSLFLVRGAKRQQADTDAQGASIPADSAAAPVPAKLAELMGPSVKIGKLIEEIEQVAASNLSVLILGETGAGKELVARAIHHSSARNQRPLITVDCGAIPGALLESELFGHERGAFTGATQSQRGLFQVADGSTLLLDEIGNLPPTLQPKLLRVLESHEVRPIGSRQALALDVRVIAATNVRDQELVGAGGLREDLYFRLAQFVIRVPPLRERTEDIPYLAQRFANEICAELGRRPMPISVEGMRSLYRHAWPGNVRELRNAVRQAIVRGHSPHVDSWLPPGTVASAAPNPAAASLQEISERAAQEAERKTICAALRLCQGNKSAAARILRVNYKTLHQKIKRYAITSADFSEPRAD